MRRGPLLVDSCYSKSDANVGRERENTDTDPQTANGSIGHLFVSVRGVAAGACVISTSQPPSRACAACAARVWVCVAESQLGSMHVCLRDTLGKQRGMWERSHVRRTLGCVVEVRGRE